MGNTTISLPEGASNHGDPRLLCLPTGWADVVVFRERSNISGKKGSSSLQHFLNWLSKRYNWFGRNVHGSFHLTQGYTLAFVPRDARFKHDLASHGDSPKTHPNTTISCQYNVVKIVVALAQTVFAITTLYRSRGNQVELYGYAAFGLTVTPYAFMSFVNLLGNLMRPQYSALYLVGSPEMDDALKDGCCFDGVVGKLDISKETVKAPSRLHWIFWTWLPLVLGAIPIAIVGAISHFDSGQSTKAQRVWTMTWLVFGTVIDIVPVSQLVQKFMGIHADVFFPRADYFS